MQRSAFEKLDQLSPGILAFEANRMTQRRYTRRGRIGALEICELDDDVEITDTPERASQSVNLFLEGVVRHSRVTIDHRQHGANAASGDAGIVNRVRITVSNPFDL
jgi:hypothetical protein